MHHLHPWIRLVFMLFIVVTSCWNAVLAQDSGLKHRIDSTFSPFLDALPNRAMVVGLIKEGETAVFTFGDLEADEKTVFDIGSITKVFTGVALSHAIVEEKLTPDTSVCDAAPELFQAESAICDVTVSELATHHSGLPRLPSNLNAVDLVTNPFADYSEEHLKEFAKEWEGNGDEMPSYLYSNVGAGMMGLILVKMYGSPSYDALLHEVMLEELGMQSTSTQILFGEDERKIQGHNVLGGPATVDWTGEPLAGMGLLRSSTDDMITFLQAFIDLPAEPTSQLQKAMHLSMEPLRPLAEGSPYSVAYFWHIHELDSGQRLWWHNGMTGAYSSYMAFDPEKKIGMIAMYNQALQAFTPKWMELLGVVFD